MRIVELIIDEEAELYGIDAISLVDRPAIELDFIALKEQRVQFAEVDADKRVLIGPALVPDKPIFRKNGEDEFYVYFSKNTVRKASELYLKHGNQAKHTLEHEHQIHGLTVVESWIVENKEQDKSHLYDLDVPVGTWMVAVKVDNEAIWQEWVKEGKVKGFSIEGYFVDKMKKNARGRDAGRAGQGHRQDRQANQVRHAGCDGVVQRLPGGGQEQRQARHRAKREGRQQVRHADGQGPSN